MEYLFSQNFSSWKSVCVVCGWCNCSRRHIEKKHNETVEKQNCVEHEATAIAWMQFVSTWDESVVVVIVAAAAAAAAVVVS